MTRLKFVRDDSILKAGPILCGTRLLTLYVLPNILVYSILDEKDKLVKSGYANNLASVKRKAKQALIELGAKFDDELRNRGKVERFKV